MGVRQSIPAANMDGTTQYPAQNPSSGTPGVIVPPQVLAVLMKTSTALTPKPSAAPPHPQVSQQLTGIPLGYQFAFNQLMSPTLYGNVISAYRIYRNTTANSFSGATLIRTITHDPTHQGAVTVQDSTSGNQQFYYFVTAVDSTGQESKQPGSFQASPVISGSVNQVAQTTVPASTPLPNSLTQMCSVSFTTHGNPIALLFTSSLSFPANISNTFATFFLYRDGVQVPGNPIQIVGIPTGAGVSAIIPVGLTWLDQPAAGAHIFAVFWYRTTGTGTGIVTGALSQLQVAELG